MLTGALLNEEIAEDEYEEAIKGIPTLKQQTDQIFREKSNYKHDVSKVAEPKALYKHVKGEITHDIKNLYNEPVTTSTNTLRKSVITLINYKIQHKNKLFFIK